LAREDAPACFGGAPSPSPTRARFGSPGNRSPPPQLMDYVFAIMPNTPDARPWTNGRDPHNLTA
jgi:hypothetical protein